MLGRVVRQTQALRPHARNRRSAPRGSCRIPEPSQTAAAAVVFTPARRSFTVLVDTQSDGSGAGGQSPPIGEIGAWAGQTGAFAAADQSCRVVSRGRSRRLVVLDRCPVGWT